MQAAVHAQLWPVIEGLRVAERVMSSASVKKIGAVTAEENLRILGESRLARAIGASRVYED